MGGLCLGSLLLSYASPNRVHPLWIYAAIEIAIGRIGIALMFGMSSISVIYSASAMQGLAGILLRGGICAALLVPPTILMGATLPCLARLARPTL